MALCVASQGCRDKRSQNVKRFDLSGTIVSVDAEHSEVTISHGEIPDYMGAMTMPFRVKDNSLIDSMHSGDNISAALVVSANSSWIEDPVVSTSVVDPNPPPTARPEPSPGTLLPDVALTNQDGKQFRLSNYKGKTVVITFIYTRCPLPDYCILMNDNFEKIEGILKQDPHLYNATRLLTISFDPEHDTPEVLRKFGLTRVDGQSPNPFGHWTFATGTSDEIRKLADFFGLTYVNEPNQIIHSLRTAVIAGDGTLVRLYDGNEWKPEQVISALNDASIDRRK